MTAPTANQRKACWDSRDHYWKCMDENKDDLSKCEKLQQIFYSQCPRQWVKYFDKRRDYLKFKEKLEAGEFRPSETEEKS